MLRHFLWSCIFILSQYSVKHRTTLIPLFPSVYESQSLSLRSFETLAKRWSLSQCDSVAPCQVSEVIVRAKVRGTLEAMKVLDITCYELSTWPWLLQSILTVHSISWSKKPHWVFIGILHLKDFKPLQRHSFFFPSPVNFFFTWITLFPFLFFPFFLRFSPLFPLCLSYLSPLPPSSVLEPFWWLIVSRCSLTGCSTLLAPWALDRLHHLIKTLAVIRLREPHQNHSCHDVKK